MSLVVLITVPEDQARDLARTLVRERLAGSVNVLPGSHSVYVWEGDVSEDTESLLLVKTIRERYAALERRVRELHPYQIPEILALEAVHELAEYQGWLQSVLPQ